jgi:outer membrane protein OmpA-like peptidoglycan-associated protein
MAFNKPLRQTRRKTMKLATLALSGLLAVVTIPPAHADDWLPAKKSATFLGATAAGVALGGPFGLVAGAVVGTWFTDKLDAADQVDESRDQLVTARMELRESRTDIAQLEAALQDSRDTSAQYAQLVLDQLQLEMLFKTNATELTTTGQQRLARLAEFLVANPQIAIRLDGYADPRGDDSYNQQLSLGRVRHVAQALEDFGVDVARIESFSHGDSQSAAPEGDYDAYALERAVKINLSQQGSAGYAVRDTQ